jgi:hypothetical protein
VDAFVHADLAGRYAPNGTGFLSQGDLFRIEAGVASLAALLVLLSAGRLVWALAFAIAASAVGAIVLYAYYDLGAIGPLPNMYEPVWYPEKTAAAVFEGIATVSAVVGFVLSPRFSTSSGGLRKYARPIRGRRGSDL